MGVRALRQSTSLPSTVSVSAREAALFVAQRLLAAQHVALFAGGCVRDRLRGEEPKDYDVATDAAPRRVKELFPSAIGVGEAFGVMLVRRAGHSVEVATFRSDGAYADGRHPEQVRFGDPRADALRRDFTINGLFEDPRSGEIIDFVDGQADLRRGLVRAIGDPVARLDEDRLRCLRAVRFAARFGYLIDPLTRQAIVMAGDLRGVSRERVGQELRRMLKDAGRDVAVAELQRMGLDRSVLDEENRLAPTPRVSGLPAGASFETALVAWLLDRWAAEQAQHLPVHDAPSSPRSVQPGGSQDAGRAALQRLVRWAEALVLSNDEIRLARSILEQVIDLEGWTDAAPWARRSVAARKRRATAEGFQEALVILGTTRPDVARAVSDDVGHLAAAGGLAPAPLVGGDELIQALRLAPGPRFKALLHEVYDAQLEGRVDSVDAALAFVQARWQEMEQGGGAPGVGGTGRAPRRRAGG